MRSRTQNDPVLVSRDDGRGRAEPGERSGYRGDLLAARSGWQDFRGIALVTDRK